MAHFTLKAAQCKAALLELLTEEVARASMIIIPALQAALEARVRAGYARPEFRVECTLPWLVQSSLFESAMRQYILDEFEMSHMPLDHISLGKNTIMNNERMTVWVLCSLTLLSPKALVEGNADEDADDAPEVKESERHVNLHSKVSVLLGKRKRDDAAPSTVDEEPAAKAARHE